MRSKSQRKESRARHRELGTAKYVLVDEMEDAHYAFPDTHQHGCWCKKAVPVRTDDHPRYTLAEAIRKAERRNEAREKAWRDFLR